MADLPLVVAMAAITYGSRVVFLVSSGPAPRGAVARFLETFPLALFVALATSSLLVGDGVGRGLGVPAFVGAILGAVVGKRSLVAALVGGGAAYLVARGIGL